MKFAPLMSRRKFVFMLFCVVILTAVVTTAIVRPSLIFGHPFVLAMLSLFAGAVIGSAITYAICMHRTVKLENDLDNSKKANTKLVTENTKLKDKINQDKKKDKFYSNMGEYEDLI